MLETSLANQILSKVFKKPSSLGRRDYDITEIDITESDVTESDITKKRKLL